ncbi:MAG: hypothetical protein ACE5I5_05080 [Candidatus Heimdallarchaeota archaeon]
MATDLLEELSNQGFPRLAWELLDNPRCLVYCDPRKERFGELIKRLLQFYTEEDKRAIIKRPKGERGRKRIQKGHSYVVVCPGYDQQRIRGVLESLDETQFTIKSTEEWKPFGRSEEEDIEKTTVYLCGPLALYNRLAKMGRQGLGVERIILFGLDEGLVGQEWYLYSNVIVRLAEFVRLRPPLCILLSHPQPTQVCKWLVALGLEPTVVQHRRLVFDFSDTLQATFGTRDDLLEHVEHLEAVRFCLYSQPPMKAAFIFRSDMDCLMQSFRVEKDKKLQNLSFYVKSIGGVKTGTLICSLHKVHEGGPLERITPTIKIALDKSAYWGNSKNFTKCQVDFSAHGISLEAGATYAMRLDCASLLTADREAGIAVGYIEFNSRERVVFSRDGSHTWQGRWGMQFIAAEEHLEFGESPEREMDAIYVHYQGFMSGVELARLAAFLKTRGHLILVNFTGDRTLMERQLVFCPVPTEWYMERGMDYILNLCRHSRTKKQLARLVEKTYPYFALGQKARVEPFGPYREEQGQFKEWLDQAFERLQAVGFIQRGVTRMKQGPHGGIGEERTDSAEKVSLKKATMRMSGYFRCTECGALIAKDYRPVKLYAEMFVRYKAQEMTEEERRVLVEVLRKSGREEPQAKTGSKPEVSFGKQAQRALRDKLWIYKICRSYDPTFRIPQFEEQFTQDLTEPKAEDLFHRRRRRLRFKTTLKLLSNHLYGVISSPLRERATKVGATRVLWYQDIAKEITVPIRSVNYLLNRYFRKVERKEVRQKSRATKSEGLTDGVQVTWEHETGDSLLQQLETHFDPLPRALLMVFQAIRLTTHSVGRGKPLLVVECRLMARGLVIPHEKEGTMCRECGLYGREDKSCAGWYNLKEEGPSYLPTTRLLARRAEYGMVTPNSTACEWFTPRVRGRILPMTAFEKVFKFRLDGRSEGWRCPRPVCTGLLDRKPKIGRVVGCQICGARYKRQKEGGVLEQVDYRAEIQRFVQHYSGLVPNLPEHEVGKTDFVYVTWDCEGRIEGDQLIVTYPTHTEAYHLSKVYVMVHTDEGLAEALQAQGVRVRFLGLRPPRHRYVSRALVEALGRTENVEKLQRRYAWGLLLSYVVATLDLAQGPVEVREGGKAVLGAQLRIIQQFVKRQKFGRGAFLACEGRLAWVVETFVREVLHQRRKRERIVRAGIGRTFGRKGDRLYYRPTQAAAGKTKLDAGQNRASKILRNILRANNAEQEYKELWLGYETVELFSHKVHDNPALAAHLDLEEPSQRLLGNRIAFAFLIRGLTGEHFQEYRSLQGFPRCAPTPRGSRALEDLVTAFLEEEVWYCRTRQPLTKAHAGHVAHLLECLGKNTPEEYQPFIPIPARLKDLGPLKKIRKFLIEAPKQLGLWDKPVTDIPHLKVGEVLTELSEILRPLEAGINCGEVVA